MEPIELRSDNAAGALPEVVAAVAAANDGSAPSYGADRWTEDARQAIGAAFERPDLALFPVPTGTAANALSLSALCPPWGMVVCHDTAHVLRSECGAASLFGGGAVIRGVASDGDGSLLRADDLCRLLDSVRWGDPHESQPAVLSLTCPTDRGAIYTPDQVAELVGIAKGRGMKVHLDGARLANALAALGCSPAALTWQAGVDVLSFGATKNGALSTDAIVSFDRAASDQLLYRVKRAGHVPSKMRFQSAQLLAYVTDGLWLDAADRANAAMRRLAAGLRARGYGFGVEPDVNMAFVPIDPMVLARLVADGVLFHEMSPGVARFVTSFRTTSADIDEVLARLDRARADQPVAAGRQSAVAARS